MELTSFTLSLMSFENTWLAVNIVPLTRRMSPKTVRDVIKTRLLQQPKNAMTYRNLW